MHIHAQPVAGTVHVERPVRLALDQRLHVTLEQAQLNQPFGDHPHGGFMGMVPVLARGDFGKRRCLGAQNKLIDSLLLG